LSVVGYCWRKSTLRRLWTSVNETSHQSVRRLLVTEIAPFLRQAAFAGGCLNMLSRKQIGCELSNYAICCKRRNLAALARCVDGIEVRGVQCHVMFVPVVDQRSDSLPRQRHFFSGTQP
jgi:hypothetical protein